LSQVSRCWLRISSRFADMPPPPPHAPNRQSWECRHYGPLMAGFNGNKRQCAANAPFAGSQRQLWAERRRQPPAACEISTPIIRLTTDLAHPCPAESLAKARPLSSSPPRGEEGAKPPRQSSAGSHLPAVRKRRGESDIRHKQTSAATIASELNSAGALP
jgi:hypothetical protein